MELEVKNNLKTICMKEKSLVFASAELRLATAFPFWNYQQIKTNNPR
jgi:hypothetical protein